MSIFGFGQSADITIQINDADNRKSAKIRSEEGIAETRYLYYDGEDVAGTATIHLKKPGQKLEHQGIRVEFIGQIEVYYDRGNHHNFVQLEKELARPGELYQTTQYKFDFTNVEKPFESYTGTNVKLRYFLRVTIVRRLTDIVRETDLIVHTLSRYSDNNNSSIKMEVGIEDCLHIEFEYNKSRYHLKDVIVGKIYFLLVRIKIKYMEIAIIKRESVGSGINALPDTEPIAKYEIMDGAPVKGESIPIRLFLAGYDLTPTLRDVCKRFNVRYFLNLVLVDEEERRYFKQQEIILWRRADLPTRQAVQLPDCYKGSTGATTSSQDDPRDKTPSAMQRYESDNDRSRQVLTQNGATDVGNDAEPAQSRKGDESNASPTIESRQKVVGNDED